MGLLIDSDMKMYGYIYITTNLINGKQYIGKRTKSKFDITYKGSGKLITEAINKYGWNNFKCEILEPIFINDQNYLCEREEYWINYFDAVNSNMFYNITEGGCGLKGYKYTEEDKHKMSESKVGNSHTKGKIWINNGLSEYMINPDDLESYISKGYSKGKLPMSESTRKSISYGVKKSLQNPETILKKRNNMIGNTYGLGNKSTKGKIRITNRINNTSVTIEDFNSYYSNNGWIRGVTKIRKKVI